MTTPTVITLETPTLGNRSYLAHDGTLAVVIDPQRDTDRIDELLEREGVRLAAVFETHVHNDYVTGGWSLAREHGAAYYVNAADEVSFERTGIHDGETVRVGGLQVTAVATPGHTFTHLSYALAGPDGAPLEAATAVFTGGSLLYGATGRPDLLGAEHTHELAAHQHASAHRLADLLPAGAEVLPTHGFGSFCSAGSSADAGATSTIEHEQQVNPVLTTGAAEWIEQVLDGLNAWPAYYAHMAPANAAGPTAADLSPVDAADAVEVRRRLDAGEWVVDLRHRTAFAAGHAPGTLNFGLDGSFATYLGWLIPWGTPLTLVGDTPEQVAEAQRELVRIGIERPAAQATGQPQQWSDGPLASFPTATFADLAEVVRHRPVTVLDVRRSDEFAARALAGALNVPLHELGDRMAEVPAGEVWVHCAGGYRASVAASLLAAHGRHPVAVDDPFDAALATDLDLVPAGA